MLTIILSVVLGAFMIIVKYRENHKISAAKSKLDLSGFTKFNFSRSFVILYAVITALGITSIIYGYVINDLTTEALGIVISMLFISEAIGARNRYQMYYNDYAFSVNGTIIRYKDIKDFEKIRNIKIAWIKIHTFSGDTVSVSQKSYEIIYPIYESKLKTRRKG